MTTDDGTEQEPGSLSGDIVPSGPGAWMTYQAAADLWKIKPKAVYRRIVRGKMLGRKNPETGDPEIWVPKAEEPGSVFAPSIEDQKEEPSALAVPDREQFALVLEASISRALSPLHETIDKQQARIEELIRENERLRIEGEQRSLWGELWERIRSRLRYN